MTAFIEDREIFLRERMNGYYTVGPYALATTIINSLFVMVSGIVFTSIAYYLIGFNPDGDAFGFFTFEGLMTSELSGLSFPCRFLEANNTMQDVYASSNLPCECLYPDTNQNCII